MPARSKRPPPVAQVVAHLADAKARGISADHFDRLFSDALRAVVWPHDTTHRQQWREAIDEAREEMLAAYEGRETRVAAIFRAIPPQLFAVDEERCHDLDRVAA